MTIAPASYTLETLGFDPSWQGSAIRAAFTLGGTLENFTLARVSAVHRTRCELLTFERGELIKLSAPLRPVENDYGEEEYPVVGDWVLTQPILEPVAIASPPEAQTSRDTAPAKLPHPTQRHPRIRGSACRRQRGYTLHR